MSNTEKNNIVETALNSEELTNLINEAAPLKVKIKVDLAKDMRENCNDFLNETAKASPKISQIMGKKRKEQTDEEKEILKNWTKIQKRKFKTVTKILAPRPNTDPLRAIVEKLTEITQYARYIGNTDLEDRLANLGIKLDVKNLEDESPYFADDDVREVIKDIFSQSKDVQTAINNANENIKGKIYEELDDSIKYSKANPSGIKSSQFSKLVGTKAVSIMKSEDQYTKYKESLLKKDSADIESREIILEKTRKL